MGVLFENSIVCHVFYAMVPWGCAWLCVVFLGLVLFWFAWLLLWGLGGAMWSGFLGCLLTVALAWLHVLLCGAWLGFCWFCLESLILAQDERWRRA